MQEIITWFRNIGEVNLVLNIFDKKWWLPNLKKETFCNQTSIFNSKFYLENNNNYYFWYITGEEEFSIILFDDFMKKHNIVWWIITEKYFSETKNSWINNTFDGWAKREDKTNKLRYDLIPTEILDSLALKYWQWAQIYWENNWRKWDEKFAKWCIASAFRHFMQWIKWDTDEDHKASICFNIYAYDILKNNKK